MTQAGVAYKRPAQPTPYNMPHLQHIDINEITAHAGRDTEALLGLLRLAVKVGREQVDNLRGFAELGDVEACRFAIHSMLNTFNFLHAHEAVCLAAELETLAHGTSNPIPVATVERLFLAWDEVEQDLISFIHLHN